MGNGSDPASESSILHPLVSSTVSPTALPASRGCGHCRFAQSVECAFDDIRLFCGNDDVQKGFVKADWPICVLFESHDSAAN